MMSSANDVYADEHTEDNLVVGEVDKVVDCAKTNEIRLEDLVEDLSTKEDLDRVLDQIF